MVCVGVCGCVWWLCVVAVGWLCVDVCDGCVWWLCVVKCGGCVCLYVAVCGGCVVAVCGWMCVVAVCG